MRVMDGVAHWISNVAAPPVLALVATLLLAQRSAEDGAWGWAAGFGVAAVLVPSAYVMIQVQRGAISDLHVSLREERQRPFLVTLGAAAAICGVFLWWQAPAGFRILAVANLVQAVVLFAVTLRWKVSLHSAAAGSLSTLSLTVLGVHFLSVTGMVLVASVPLISWARVRLERHTLAQTMVGAAVGCLVTILAVWVV